jgi:hypothetical protein
VSLVLRPSFGRPHAQGVAEGGVDLVGVIRGTPVEQQPERCRARGVHAILEGLDHSLAVLGVADRRAHDRTGIGIDVELEIEGEAGAVDLDRDLHAIADPLGSGEEHLEAVSGRALVGRAARPPPWATLSVHVENAADEGAAVWDAQVVPHVVAEGREWASPALPGGEDGLDARRARALIISGVRFLGVGLVAGRTAGAEPVLDRAPGHGDRLGEGVELEGGVGLT